MQPSKPPRGFTIGIAVQLFGIALAIFGLTVPYSTGGPTTPGSPVIAGFGVAIALVGLMVHVVRL